MYYVVIDAPGDDQHDAVILGVFSDETRAREVAADHARRFETHYGQAWWMRQILVLLVAELDVENRIDYTAKHPWGNIVFI